MSPQPLSSPPQGSRRSPGGPCFHLLILAGLTLGAGACGGNGSSATDPTPAQPEVAPTITGLRVGESPTTYIRATLAASVSDSNDNLADAVVNWGDGKSSSVNSQLDAIDLFHDYARDGTYTVTLTASDLAGNETSASSRLTFDPVPGECFDVSVLKLCGQIQPDYKGIALSVSALNIDIDSFTLTTSSTSKTTFYQVVGPLGQVKAVTSAVFSRTKGQSNVTVKVYGCTFSLCTSELGSQVFWW
jgi:PKD domain